MCRNNVACWPMSHREILSGLWRCCCHSGLAAGSVSIVGVGFLDRRKIPLLQPNNGLTHSRPKAFGCRIQFRQPVKVANDHLPQTIPKIRRPVASLRAARIRIEGSGLANRRRPWTASIARSRVTALAISEALQSRTASGGPLRAALAYMLLTRSQLGARGESDHQHSDTSRCQMPQTRHLGDTSGRFRGVHSPFSAVRCR